MEGGDLCVSSIDERVVSMQFDNKQFEAGVSKTLGSLDSLNKGLKLEGATKGLNDLDQAAKRFSLANISDSLGAITDKFKALSVVGITALVNIANKAVNAGEQLIHSLTVEPIMQGLHEYETNLNSIQTILSNTAWQHTGLKDVNAALQELNTYSDKTIYNFSEMARNIGTFTAAGVKLDVSVSAIKGIANLAAISGSNAEQASAAMYQLSQALASGTVKLQDWNSVVNAGLGGKVFQDALIETARVHGVAIDQMIKDEGGFRNTLEKGWLTSGILTETLSKFTGDLSAAQLKTMGYTDAQIQGILKLGKNAQEAATKIKTFSQLINTLQEAAGSGWASTWQLIFGDFDEARDLFTNVNNVLGGFISASAAARNKVLGDWKELGGRTKIIEAISNAFKAVLDVLGPIKTAFREIFPAVTGKDLYNLTVILVKFTESLRLSADTMSALRRTAAGVFAVLGIGWDILKAVVKVLFNLIGVATEGSGGFLEFTAKIGDFLVGLHKAVEEGTALTDFFQAVGRVLAVPIRLIKILIGYVGGLFGSFDGDKAAASTSNWLSKLNLVTTALNAIASGGEKLNSFISGISANLPALITKIVNFLTRVTTWIVDAFRNIDWGDVLSTINTGLFAGIVVLFKKFVDKFKKESPGSDLLSGIKDSFDQLTKTLSTMQNTLRAATLLEIAAAIALLTISVVALSKVDANGLTRALTAIAIMMGQLLTSMAIFEKIAGTKGFAKLPIIAGTMILLAIAVDLLVIAVANLAKLGWEELAKGLSGVAAILASLALYSKFAEANAAGVLSGAGIILLAVGINILADAVAKFGQLSWGEIAKGLVVLDIALGSIATALDAIPPTAPLAALGVLGVALSLGMIADALEQFAKASWGEIAKSMVVLLGVMTLIAAALIVIPPTAPLGALAILGVAISLGLIADALDQFAKQSWGEIGKSMTVLLGVLTLITAALLVIPPWAPLAAASILLVAWSLNDIATAMERFGKMSWGEIAKAMVVFTGILTILTVGLTLMIAALPGAAAMVVVAAALAILTPILLVLGNMSWEAIAKGLVTLAGVFAIFGAAGLLLAPVVPILLGLGVAVALVGVGMLAAGAGVFALSLGLTALAISGAAGASALIGIINSMLAELPIVAAAIAQAVVAFAAVIAESGPAITGAITTVLNSLIDAILKLTPKIQETLAKLILGMLLILAKYVPQMVDAGLKLLTGILNGIANNIDRVVTAATNIIVNFLKTLGNNIPRIVQAGVDLILSLIRGLTKAINDNSDAMGKAGADLGIAIVKGMARGLLSAGGEVADAAKNVAKKALDAAKDWLGIKSPSKKAQEEIGEPFGEGAAKGITKSTSTVTDAAKDLGDSAIETMRKSLKDISDVVSGDVDLNPKITPVLDLTKLRKDANQVNGMFKPISFDATTKSANDAAAGHPSNQPPPPDGAMTTGAPSVTFVQNNNSPKALDAATIYRQTKNQLSKVKEVVAP